MTNNSFEVNNLLLAVSGITQSLPFSVLFYDCDSENMFSLHKGEAIKVETPDSVKPYLSDQKAFYAHFSRGAEFMTVHFIRINIDKNRYVLVIQDNEQRDCLNRFTAELFKIVQRPDFAEKEMELAEKDGLIALLEHRIKELSESLNERSEDYNRKELSEKQPEVEEQASLYKALSEKFDNLSREYEELAQISSKKSLQYEDAIRNLADQQAAVQERESCIEALGRQIADLNLKLKQDEERCQNIQDALAEKEEQAVGMRESIEEKEKRIGELVKSADAVTELNNVLRQSRDKLGELVNGLAQPIFSVGSENKVVTANKALTAFCGAAGADEILGRRCSEAVHNVKEGDCPWCMLEKVRTDGEPVQIPVVVENESQKRHLDILFFPIFDSDKNLLEVAEFITDRTEVVELAHSLIKFKEKLRDFKKARIEDMYEVSEVKKAYQELSAEHERLVEKNGKMLKLIERLVSEDKAKELLKVRRDLMETRNTLIRSNETTKNYRFQLEEQLAKYGDLNRRTFIQMERLLNIMKSKASLTTGEETTTILNFLAREFNLVKKHFIETREKSDADDQNAKEERAKPRISFKYEEEEQLEKRFNAEKKPVVKQSGAEVQISVTPHFRADTDEEGGKTVES